MNKVTLASAVARLKRRELRKQKAILNREWQKTEPSEDSIYYVNCSPADFETSSSNVIEQEISEESEDLPLDDILQKRFEDKDNIAFTFEKGISREEIRETNHKLRAQIRKQLNIQEDLDKQDQEN